MSLFCCVVNSAAPLAPGTLETIARACSPRVDPHGADVVVFDASGLARVFGTPDDLVRAVVDLAEVHGAHVRVAIAPTITAAWLLAHASPTHTVVGLETMASRLASLSIRWLATLPDVAVDGAPHARRRARARHYRMAPGPGGGTPASTLTGALATFERWGVHALGGVAALPRADLHARMGPLGVRLHQAACGEDDVPLVPAGEPVRFRERLDLEWPIEGLEPLAFVLARQCEALSLALERADRGAVVITTRLQLVTRETHERTLHLPGPMRDARVLRTLIVLDLESAPPPAAIDAVEIDLEVTPGRVLPGTLFASPLPTVEDLATLLARLGALMGESRVGAPSLVDSHDERVVAMAPFRIRDEKAQRAALTAPTATVVASSVLRRYRVPLAVRVTVERGAPVAVASSARGLPNGRVIACAGPWRTSGRWWTFDRSAWDRDEWDVELSDGGVYRLARHRTEGQWVVEGVHD